MDIPIHEDRRGDRMAIQLFAQSLDFKRVGIQHMPVFFHEWGIYPKLQLGTTGNLVF
jgi:hypothetical protein